MIKLLIQAKYFCKDITDLHEPNSTPTNEDMMRCVKYSPKSTQLCGYTARQQLLRFQTRENYQN
jgi:hypothetical protein